MRQRLQLCRLAAPLRGREGGRERASENTSAKKQERERAQKSESERTSERTNECHGGLYSAPSTTGQSCRPSVDLCVCVPVPVPACVRVYVRVNGCGVAWSVADENGSVERQDGRSCRQDGQQDGQDRAARDADDAPQDGMIGVCDISGELLTSYRHTDHGSITSAEGRRRPMDLKQKV